MIAHPPIMNNEQLNNQLFSEGFVTLPFLNDAEVAAARELFFQYHDPAAIKGFYVASHHLSLAVQMEIHLQLQAIFERAVRQHIQNMRCLGGTFMVKGYDPDAILHPHQDWSIVDERFYRSYTIWVALQDITDDNGALYVLPGSHDIFRGYRHITIPSIFGKIYDLTWKYMQPVHLRSGEAIIFDHALAHASLSNRTPQLRLTATNSLLSQGAEYRFYFNNNGVVEEYEGDPYYYIDDQARYSPGHLKKIRTLDVPVRQLDEASFLKIYGARKKHSWLSFSRIQNKLSNLIKRQY